MHRHMVTILYTQECIQSPPTDVQHTRYILYTGLNRVYTEIYTQYTQAHQHYYIQIFTQVHTTQWVTTNRLIHRLQTNRYRPYTCRLYRLYMHRVYYTHLYTVNTGQYTGLQYM